MFFNNPKPTKTEQITIDDKKPLSEQLTSIPENQLQRLVQQANNFADMQQYERLMDEIYEKMRRSPVPKSELANPEDTNALQKVEFPQEGGVLTWMDNHFYPYRGYPHYKFVEKLDFVKKVNRAFLSGLYHQMKSRKKLLFITLLPGIWAAKDFARVWMYTSYKFIERFLIKEDKYCQFVRELHQSFSEDQHILRDLICTVLELDNAYRFRAQDIIAEIDKVALRKHPIRELLRLLEIISEREKTQEIKDTWKLVRYFVKWYLRFDRKMLWSIVDALLLADIEKCVLTKEDKEYCIPRVDYTFGFVLNPTPSDQRMIELQDVTDEYKQTIKETRNESTVEHEKVKEDPARLSELDKKYESIIQEITNKYKEKKEKLLAPLNTSL